MKAVAINTLRFRVDGKRVEVPAGRTVDMSKEQYDEFFALGAVAPVGDEAANAVIDATGGNKTAKASKPAPKAKAEAKPKPAPESKPEDAGDDDADDEDEEV